MLTADVLDVVVPVTVIVLLPPGTLGEGSILNVARLLELDTADILFTPKSSNTVLYP